jgi:hypothetical protein
MLRIQVDMFSGRPNPECIITDADAVTDLLDAVGGQKGVTARPHTGFLGLGFRELRVTNLGDDPVRRRGVPRDFALASVAAEDLAASGELAMRVVETMERSESIRLVAHELTPLTADLRELILDRLRRYLADPPDISIFKWPPYNPLRTTVKDDRCKECEYEVASSIRGSGTPRLSSPTTTATTTRATGGRTRSPNQAAHMARGPARWRAERFRRRPRRTASSSDAIACPSVNGRGG